MKQVDSRNLDMFQDDHVWNGLPLDQRFLPGLNSQESLTQAESAGYKKHWLIKSRAAFYKPLKLSIAVAESAFKQVSSRGAI